MSGFELQRLGLLMEPEPGNPLEAGGVLNFAAARGPDGRPFRFLQRLALCNYSRNGTRDKCGAQPEQQVTAEG